MNKAHIYNPQLIPIFRIVNYSLYIFSYLSREIFRKGGNKILIIGVVIAYNVSMGISGKDIVFRMSQLKPIKCYVSELGIPAQTISSWKTKDIPPKAPELLAIANYLNVSIEWLLTGEEKTIPQNVLDLAYEINALPEVYKKIVFDTVQTLKSSATEQEKEEQQNIG